MPPTIGETTPTKTHDDLLKSMIESCVSMEDLVRIYESDFFQDHFKRLPKSQGGMDPEVWAREWAIRLRTTGDEADEALNKARKVCLSLLYKLCDCWKDDSNSSVTKESIVKDFKARRIVNILAFCLVLDRAQCLYKMKYPGSAAFGMHWVSKQHVERENLEGEESSSDDNTWESRLQKVGGRPTMNKRLIWLLELTELGLQDIAPIVKWLQPQRCDVLE